MISSCGAVDATTISIGKKPGLGSGGGRNTGARTPVIFDVWAKSSSWTGKMLRFRWLESGVRVPADVAVTGFDDVHASRVIDPPLTTVSQPLRELGSRATYRLLARIEDPALAPDATVLPTQVVIRASCGCQGRGTTQAGVGTHR